MLEKLDEKSKSETSPTDEIIFARLFRRKSQLTLKRQKPHVHRPILNIRKSLGGNPFKNKLEFLTEYWPEYEVVVKLPKPYSDD